MNDPEPGTMVAGTYRLVEPIASGGMGSIWRAVHDHLDAPVAVKFMHASLLDHDRTRERFSREAKAAARIQSPHVVHIHDYGIDPASGLPFIVMEALEGEDLGRRLKRLGRLALPDALRICQQICLGLARAHEAGILHRDLKPANVFLCERDDDLVKILDFGIAKQLRGDAGDDLTATGELLGSPQYMSPEQIRSLPLDARSDLWSLGVIMYRMLTGQLPFNGREMSAVFVQICADPIRPPSQLAPDLPEALDGFFARALERDPAWRYESAGAFAQAFEQALAEDDEHRSAPAGRTMSASEGSIGRRVVADDENVSPLRAAASQEAVRLATTLVLLAISVAVVLFVVGPHKLEALRRALESALDRLQQMRGG